MTSKQHVQHMHTVLTGSAAHSVHLILLYCKTLNIHGVKFSRFNENDILAHFNFGVHDIVWLKIVKKFDINLLLST